MAKACEICGLLHVEGPFARRCLYFDLRDALGDITPTPEEDRILRWLARSDESTVLPIAGLIARLRAGGSRGG